MGDPQSLKEEGNGHFKGGNYKEAVRCYTEALNTGTMNDTDKAVIYKNRAQCRLKMNNHLDAVEDCTASLELVENDPKALFRRCQGYEALGKMEDAYRDVITLMKVDPKNAAAVAIYERLNPIMQDKMKQQTNMQSKVSQMFNLAFDASVPNDKRNQALNNLIVLSREDAGANLILHQGGIPHLTAALKEKDVSVIIGAMRVLATMCKNSEKRAEAVKSAVDMTFVMTLLGQGSAEVTAAATHLVQQLLNWYAGLEEYVKAVENCEQLKKKGERTRWPQFKLTEDKQQFVDQVFNLLIKMFDSNKVTPEGRDSAMELVMKNVTYKKGLSWTGKFLDTDGIDRLLTVAGTQKQFKTLTVSDKSRMHASVTLSTVYEDTVSDKQRDKYKEKCSTFLRDLFGDGDFESKIEAIEIISSLLQGPYEVGSMLLGIEGVVDIMFGLAASDNQHYQRVAVEAIVNSASKKDRCTGILKDAIPILKNLYLSNDESIQVRALVGLCKLGSFAGGDATAHPMADGSTLKLSRICRKFLVNTTKDCDLRKWATEGLAYLTLDAEVKEELINDTPALKSICDLAKNVESNMTYACVSVLVNLTNSYDKMDLDPQMVELAKFAKQHVPEEHEKDKHEFVIQRIHKLAQAGVTNALVALSDTESKNSRELICRVFLAMATEVSLRGLLVQQGAVKVLLQLINNNTDNGTVMAAHTLAKIAVTLDPTTAFPGQRVYEVVRPFISLLHNDRSGLQNFEALLSLTNLASTTESVRKRILADQGLQAIESCMFEDHQMIRRAATQCMCNMYMSEKVQELAEDGNDRVKMMVLFSGDEDPALVLAASGALAFISANPKLRKKIAEVPQCMEILQQILVTEDRGIQHRACHLAMNLMQDKDIATKLVDSPVLEILMAITKLEEPGMEPIQACAQQGLDAATRHNLIRPIDSHASNLEALRQVMNMKKLALKQAEEREEEEAQRAKEEEERKNALNRQLNTIADEEYEEEFGEETAAGDKQNDDNNDGNNTAPQPDAADRLKADPAQGQGQEGQGQGGDPEELRNRLTAEADAISNEEPPMEPESNNPGSGNSAGTESSAESQSQTAQLAGGSSAAT